MTLEELLKSNRIRKRHQAVYDAQTDITETEAEDLLTRAKDFVSIIRRKIDSP